MSCLIVSVKPGVPDQRLSVQLQELTFDLVLTWNARSEQWSLSMADAEGDLFSGHALVLDTPILWQYQHPRAPPGELFVVDTSEVGEEPGLADLGARVLLVYSEG